MVWQCSLQTFLRTTAPLRERNLIWYVFTNKAVRQLFLDWESYAQCLLAQFRADCSRYLGQEVQLQALVEDLQLASPEFLHWWSRHEILRRSEWRKELEHPLVGRLKFDSIRLEMPEAPGIRLIVYSPAPKTETARKLLLL